MVVNFNNLSTDGVVCKSVKYVSDIWRFQHSILSIDGGFILSVSVSNIMKHME